jgi:hypothetical protein
MLGDLLAELRAQASERIRNPLLGPFTAGWLVANWRLVSVLLFSDQSIEQRIQLIDENYLSVSNLLVAPLIFALLFALLIPWVNWGIQYLQEIANLGRRKHKLLIDTDYLRASSGRAEAQADLNRILAKDQITQRQKDEIETLKRQLAEQQQSAQSRIAETEAELAKRRKEYEERSHVDNAAAEKEREEINRLRAQLEDEQARARAESEKVRAELRERQKDLEVRLEERGRNPLSSANVDFESVFSSRKFRLFHNPKVGPERSKVIAFDPNGRIVEGGNKNEHSWRIVEGKLELVQADGRVHSRFFYLPDSEIFVHTGDSDTRSARGQYIIPEKK